MHNIASARGHLSQLGGAKMSFLRRGVTHDAGRASTAFNGALGVPPLQRSAMASSTSAHGESNGYPAAEDQRYGCGVRGGRAFRPLPRTAGHTRRPQRFATAGLNSRSTRDVLDMGRDGQAICYNTRPPLELIPPLDGQLHAIRFRLAYRSKPLLWHAPSSRRAQEEPQASRGLRHR